jgi:hypothetical protein
LLILPAAEIQSCTGADRPVVAASFSGLWAPALEETVLADLAADLVPTGRAVCAPTEEGIATASSAPARVDLRWLAPASVAIAIEGVDTVPLSRQIDLRRVPEDGRALTIAVAAGELLRAGWIRPAAVEPPTPVATALRAAPLSPAPLPLRETPRDLSVGVRAAFEHYQGGQTQLGFDLQGALWLSERAGAELSLGLRNNATGTQTPSGEIDSRAVGASASVLFALLPRGGMLGLDVQAGARLLWVRYEGLATPAAIGKVASDVAVYLRGGLAAHVALGSALSLGAAAGVGAPLRSFSADAAGHPVTAVSDLELYAQLGAAISF